MSIRLPQKPRPGLHAINELTRAVNGLIDYISSFDITGISPIKIHRDMFKTIVDIELNDSQYDGFFKVVIDGSSCRVINGADENDAYAGYAYYNIKKVACQRSGSISAQTGYLCLSVGLNSSAYTVSYGFENSIPDMPTLSDSSDDNTVKYPLAYCYRKNNKWQVQQLCYGLPQLWCFGTCDEPEEE